MSAPLVVDMSAHLFADMRILHECSSCCRDRGPYMSAPLVADIEHLTCVLMFY